MGDAKLSVVPPADELAARRNTKKPRTKLYTRGEVEALLTWVGATQQQIHDLLNDQRPVA